MEQGKRKKAVRKEYKTIRIKYKKSEGSLVVYFDDHQTKHLGLRISDAINGYFNDKLMTPNDFATLKLTCKFEKQS